MTAAAPTEEKHGIYRSYRAGCRCDPCRAANTDQSRTRRKRRTALIDDVAILQSEAATEALARSVACPVCGVKPELRCHYKGDLVRYSSYSHTGRLNLARGVQ